MIKTKIEKIPEKRKEEMRKIIEKRKPKEEKKDGS